MCVINTVLSVSVALPAAYAFSRYRFLGDKHLFFWLLTNRMAPPAVFALPFLQLYSAVGLFDTPWAVALAHTLFNIPLAVWILEGFMSGVPKELDETAYVDGYSFWRFFFRIFMPTIAAGIGVACFFCFMFSWVELLLAKTLTSVAAKPIAATDDARRPAPPATSSACSPRRARSPSSPAPWSSISCATTSPRASPSAACEQEGGHGRYGPPSRGWPGPGRRPRSSSSSCFASSACRSGSITSPGGAPRHGILGLDTTRGDRLFISLLGSAFIMLAWLGFVGPPLWVPARHRHRLRHCRVPLGVGSYPPPSLCDGGGDRRKTATANSP